MDRRTPEPLFDIFRGIPMSKNAVWAEAVRGLAAARERMEKIAAEKPGPYFIFSAAGGAVLAKIDTRNLLRSDSPPSQKSGVA